MLLSYLFLPLVLCLAAACTKTPEKPTISIVQQTTLSDQWYPHHKANLQKMLDEYFALAAKHFTLSSEQPGRLVALVAPHAGYHFSGLCAASAYQALLTPGTGSIESRRNSIIKRVIILAPCHTLFHHGIALPDYTVYKTVLGDVPVDTTAVKKLSKHPPFAIDMEPHIKEHAVEMQLPLLQKTVRSFSIVPLVVGKLSPDEVLTAADQLAGIIDAETLVVVSSDFTHHGSSYDYQPFSQQIQLNIRRLDSLACQTLTIPSRESFNQLLEQTHATICGQEPLRILLTMLEGGAFGDTEAEVASYYTSAQMQLARHEQGIAMHHLFSTPSDEQSEQSVSYLGLIYRLYTPPPTTLPTLNAFEKTATLAAARLSLENHLAEEPLNQALFYPFATPRLEENPGVFVTLRKADGNLRGCIGRVELERPLQQSTCDLALAAAFADNRFLPLAPGEVPDIRLEVSMLSKPQPINDVKEIVLGKHGIILKKFDLEGELVASALFLPGVPREMNWTLEETLDQLCAKAGLPTESWKRNCSFAVFETVEIKE